MLGLGGFVLNVNMGLQIISSGNGQRGMKRAGKQEQHQPLASKNSSSELSMDSCAMFCRHQ